MLGTAKIVSVCEYRLDSKETKGGEAEGPSAVSVGGIWRET